MLFLFLCPNTPSSTRSVSRCYNAISKFRLPKSLNTNVNTPIQSSSSIYPIVSTTSFHKLTYATYKTICEVRGDYDDERKPCDEKQQVDDDVYSHDADDNKA